MGWRQQWRKGARVWGTWGSGRGELGSWPWQPWLGTRTRGRGRGVGDLSTEVCWPVREASRARISTEKEEEMTAGPYNQIKHLGCYTGQAADEDAHGADPRRRGISQQAFRQVDA